MIYNQPGHIEMIRNGLRIITPASVLYHPMPYRIVKTQTRRPNRGIYKVGRDYAVQRKRGAPAEPGIRIVMDRIWEEPCFKPSSLSPNKYHFAPISSEDAWAEGGYTPEEFEKVFRELNPKWDGWSRWVFEFHCIEAQK